MQLKLPVSITAGLVMVIAVALGVGWMRSSNKVPAWAEERGILQAYIAGMDLASALAYPVSWVTGKEYLSALRSVISSLHFPKDFNCPSMKVSHAQLDGVGAQVFSPQPSPDYSPAIVYLHGGGWSMVDAGIYEETCHRMAVEFNVVVISIDYRQAPEEPFPVPFEDCLKAVIHVLSNAQSLGLDPNRIALAGDSAGGNLAAAVSLRLSQADMAGTLPPLQFQVLIYPALQMVDLNTHSYTNFSATGMLSKRLMTQMWLSYLGYPELYPHLVEFEANHHSYQLLQDPRVAFLVSPDHLPEGMKVPGVEPSRPVFGNPMLAARVLARIVDPYFSPLMAQDLSRVPRAYVILSNIDVLRDDGALYVKRLRRAGVEVEVDFYTTMSHGFFMVPSARRMTFQRTAQAFSNLGKYVKKHL